MTQTGAITTRTNVSLCPHNSSKNAIERKQANAINFVSRRTKRGNADPGGEKNCACQTPLPETRRESLPGAPGARRPISHQNPCSLV